MALYLVQGAYTAEALATMAKNPQDRSVPVRELVQKLGGQLVGFYFCFGEYDAVALAELPDDSAATAFALAVAGPGHLKAYKTTYTNSLSVLKYENKGGSYSEAEDQWQESRVQSLTC
jgi:uncharacterized protein with GYD domain